VDNPACSTAEMWTNASVEPSLGSINPYPFVGLNHFTVPVGIFFSPGQHQNSKTPWFSRIDPLGHCAFEVFATTELSW